MRGRGAPRGLPAGRRRLRLAGAVAAILALLGWRLARELLPAGHIPGNAGSGPPAGLSDCRLARAVDGDSFEVRCGDRWERVRLLRIDTPEFGEPGFAEARRALVRMLREGPFRLEAEGPSFERDRYGRLLAYAWSARGELVNEEMVRLGWSRFVTRYGGGRHAERFRRAETEARKARRGLWRLEEGRWGRPGPVGTPARPGFA